MLDSKDTCRKSDISELGKKETICKIVDELKENIASEELSRNFYLWIGLGVQNDEFFSLLPEQRADMVTSMRIIIDFLKDIEAN